MKLKHLFVSLFAAAAVFAGCEKEKNEDSGLPVISIENAEIEVAKEGGRLLSPSQLTETGLPKFRKEKPGSASAPLQERLQQTSRLSLLLLILTMLLTVPLPLPSLSQEVLVPRTSP